MRTSALLHPVGAERPRRLLAPGFFCALFKDILDAIEVVAGWRGSQAKGGIAVFMAVSIAYVTCPDRNDAERLARALLTERLIACANVIDGMTSLYRWDGEVRLDSEVVLILKTTGSVLAALIARINELHVYDCPCVAAWPITDGNPEFLKWVAAEIASSHDLIA